ncbi:hypothetical protein HAX54_014954 [Datura stramonium]|uniref:Uncharacterized protein n=1 Tax=Datura stramonium TaxID=4076 RepID=A0ABS8TQU6_DATST|nr:hypothetical protein [Datura stramonium]
MGNAIYMFAHGAHEVPVSQQYWRKRIGPSLADRSRVELALLPRLSLTRLKEAKRSDSYYRKDFANRRAIESAIGRRQALGKGPGGLPLGAKSKISLDGNEGRGGREEKVIRYWQHPYIRPWYGLYMMDEIGLPLYQALGCSEIRLQLPGRSYFVL